MWTRSGVSGATSSSSKGDRKRSSNGSGSKSKKSSRSDASKSSSRSVNQDVDYSSRRGDDDRRYDDSSDQDRQRDQTSSSSRRKRSEPAPSSPSTSTKVYKYSDNSSSRRGQERGPQSDGEGEADPEQLSHNASLMPNQFPGQTPLEYSLPSIRPDTSSGGFGAAAEFYNDQGESVHRQPGVRPSTPLITDAEPHLMAALPEAKPPEETGQGAAAEFYNSPNTAASEVSYQTAASQNQGSYASTVAAGAAATGVGAAALAAGYGSPSGSGPSTSQRPTKKPSKHSSSSIPLAAAGAGVAGLGAAAYAHHVHHHGSQQVSQSSYSNNGKTSRPARAQSGRPAPVPYAAGMSASYQEQRREDRGPVTKFVDWWKNYDDVRKMEEYTEYIGVCRYCFDPQSDPRQAPRKHRPHRQPSREFRDRRRVDKENRYGKGSSSSGSDSEGGNKGVLAAGLVGLGLASAAKSKSRKDFEDYSVKSGRRQSQTALDPDPRRASSDRRASAAKDRIASDASGTRGNVMGTVAGAAAGVGIAEAIAGSESPSTRRRTSGESGTVRRRRSNKASMAAGQSSESESNVGFFGRIFSPSSKKKSKNRRQSSSGVYKNDSLNSSLVSGLAYGREEPPQTKSRSRREPTARDASNAILGLGTAAALLASAESKRKGSSRRQPEVIAVRESRNRPSNPPLTRDRLNQLDDQNEDGWEDASDSEKSSSVDTGLAFGDLHLSRNNSARRSSGSIDSTGSAGGGWGWGWGGKKKRRQRRASPPADKRRTSGAVLPTIVASPPAIDEPVGTMPSRRRDSAAVDEEVSQGPLRYIDPRPVSDFSTPVNAEDPSTRVPRRADVRDVPLQQPQPKPAVRPPRYDAADQYDRFDVRSGATYPPGQAARDFSRVEAHEDSPFPEGYNFPKRRQTEPVMSSGGSRESPIGSHRIDSPSGRTSRDQSHSKLQDLARDAAVVGAVAGVAGVAASAMSSSDRRSRRQSSQNVRFATDDEPKTRDSTDAQIPYVADTTSQRDMEPNQSPPHVTQTVEPPAVIPVAASVPAVDESSSGRERKTTVNDQGEPRDLSSSSFVAPTTDDTLPSIPGAFGPTEEGHDDLDHIEPHSTVEVRYQGQTRDHEPILDDEIFDPNFFKRARAQSEPQIEPSSGARGRTASVVIRDVERRYNAKAPSQAEFFSPPELAFHASALDSRVDADIGPSSAGTDEFGTSRDMPSSPLAGPVSRAMASVPRLNVIAPTPPGSYAGSARDPHSRSASPIIPGADGDDTVTEKDGEKSTSSPSRVTWADDVARDRGPSNAQDSTTAPPEPSYEQSRDFSGHEDLQGRQGVSSDAHDVDSYGVEEVRPKRYMPGTFSDEENQISTRTVSPPRTSASEVAAAALASGAVANTIVQSRTSAQEARSTGLEDDGSLEDSRDATNDNWNDVPSASYAPQESKSSKKGKKSKKRRSQPSAASWEDEVENESGRRSPTPEDKASTSARDLTSESEAAGPVEMDQSTASRSLESDAPRTDGLSSSKDDSTTLEDYTLPKGQSTDSLLDLEKGIEQVPLLEERQRSLADAYSHIESYRDVPEMKLLPDSRPDSPYGPEETARGPESEDVDNNVSTPLTIKAPSATAVPLPFYRRTPQSPWSNRESPVTSPAGNDESPTSRKRYSRPNSVDFKSNEFRPLYLLERNRKAPANEPGEELPSLPSSHTTSRASSVLDADERFESALQSPHQSPMQSAELPTGAEDSRQVSTGEYLDSQQATPRASAVSDELSEVPDLPLDGSAASQSNRDQFEAPQIDPSAPSKSRAVDEVGSPSASARIESKARAPLPQPNIEAPEKSESSSFTPELAMAAAAGVAGGALLAGKRGKLTAAEDVAMTDQPVEATSREIGSSSATGPEIAPPSAADELSQTRDAQGVSSEQLPDAEEDDTWAVTQSSRGKKSKKAKKGKKNRPTPIQTSSPPSVSGAAARLPVSVPRDTVEEFSEATEQQEALSRDEAAVVEAPLTARRDSELEMTDDVAFPSEPRETHDRGMAQDDADYLEEEIRRRTESHLAPDETEDQQDSHVAEDAILEDFDRWKHSRTEIVSPPASDQARGADSDDGFAQRDVGDSSARHISDTVDAGHEDTTTTGISFDSRSGTEYSTRDLALKTEPQAATDVTLPHNRLSTSFERSYSDAVEQQPIQSSDEGGRGIVPEEHEVSARQPLLQDGSIISGAGVDEDTEPLNAYEADREISEEVDDMHPADVAFLDSIINRKPSESHEDGDAPDEIVEPDDIDDIAAPAEYIAPEDSLAPEVNDAHADVAADEDETFHAANETSDPVVDTLSLEPHQVEASRDISNLDNDFEGSVDPPLDVENQGEEIPSNAENFVWTAKSKKKGKKGKKGKRDSDAYEPEFSSQPSTEVTDTNSDAPLSTAGADPDEEWGVPSKGKKKKKGKKSSLPFAAVVGAAAAAAASSTRSDKAAVEPSESTVESTTVVGSVNDDSLAADDETSSIAREPEPSVWDYLVRDADVVDERSPTEVIDDPAVSDTTIVADEAETATTSATRELQDDGKASTDVPPADESPSASTPIEADAEDEWTMPSTSKSKKKDKKKKKQARLQELPADDMEQDTPTPPEEETSREIPPVDDFQGPAFTAPVVVDAEDEWDTPSSSKSKKSKKKARFAAEPATEIPVELPVETSAADEATVEFEPIPEDSDVPQLSKDPAFDDVTSEQLLESARSIEEADPEAAPYTTEPVEGESPLGTEQHVETKSPSDLPTPGEPPSSAARESYFDTQPRSASGLLTETHPPMDSAVEQETPRNVEPAPNTVPGAFPEDLEDMDDEPDFDALPPIHPTVSDVEVPTDSPIEQQMRRVDTSDFLEELREEESQSPDPYTTTSAYTERRLSAEPVESAEQAGPIAEVVPEDVNEPASTDPTREVAMPTEAGEDEWDMTPKSKKKSKKGKNKAVSEPVQPESVEDSLDEPASTQSPSSTSKSSKGKKGKKDKKGKKTSLFAFFQSSDPPKKSKSKSSKRVATEEADQEDDEAQDDALEESPPKPRRMDTTDFLEREENLEDGFGGEGEEGMQFDDPEDEGTQARDIIEADVDDEGQIRTDELDDPEVEAEQMLDAERALEEDVTMSREDTMADGEEPPQDVDIVQAASEKLAVTDEEMPDVEDAASHERSVDPTDPLQDDSQFAGEEIYDQSERHEPSQDPTDVEADDFLDEERAIEEDIPVPVDSAPAAISEGFTRQLQVEEHDSSAIEIAPKDDVTERSVPVTTQAPFESTDDQLAQEEDDTFPLPSSKMSKKERKKAKKAKKKQWTPLDELAAANVPEEDSDPSSSSQRQTLPVSKDDEVMEAARSAEEGDIMDGAREFSLENAVSDQVPTVTSSEIAALPTFEHTAERSLDSADTSTVRRTQSISKLWPSQPTTFDQSLPRSSSETRKGHLEDIGFAATLAAGLAASGFDRSLALPSTHTEEQANLDRSTSPVKIDEKPTPSTGARGLAGGVQESAWSFSRLDDTFAEEEPASAEAPRNAAGKGDDITFDDVVSIGLGSAGFDPSTTRGTGDVPPASTRSIQPEQEGIESEIGAVTMRTPSPKSPTEQWLSSSRRASPVSAEPKLDDEETRQQESLEAPAALDDDVAFTFTPAKQKKKKGKKGKKAREEPESSWEPETTRDVDAGAVASTLPEAAEEIQDRAVDDFDAAMDVSESPRMSFDSQNRQVIRDSGYHDTMPTTPASKTSEFNRDSGELVASPPASLDQRVPSPVESTSKDRTSALFQSPPNLVAGQEITRSIPMDESTDVPATEDRGSPESSKHADLRPTVEDGEEPLQDRFGSNLSPTSSMSPTAHHRSQSRELDTIVESSPERPAQSGSIEDDETENLPSELQGRFVSPTASEIANSRRPYARASANASPVADFPRAGSALSARSRTPGSVVSNQSGTLRRSNPSSDLGGEFKRGEAQARGYPANGKNSGNIAQNIAIERPPSYDPLKGSGRVSSRDMSDTGVYEGYGDARESTRSPSRPQSVRKRQSLQIMDLENRLDQVMAENRSLQEASGVGASGSRDLSEGSLSRDEVLRQKDVEINTIRSSLETLQQEIERLRDHNEQLSAENRNLSDHTNERSATVQAEHDSVHQQWQQTSRELEQEREKHNALRTGMEAAVGLKVTSAISEKNAEIKSLRDQLSSATEQIRSLQSQIQESSTSRGISGAGQSSDDFLNVRTEDYIDSACHQLCSHVQQWVLRFSKFSDMRACRLSPDIHDESIETRLDNAVLDGTDVDVYLADRIKRRDIFMSLTMSMIWEYVFTRYLFGLDRTQRQTLKNLEKTLSEVGPQRAVAQWRATTLTLLSRRESYAEQRETDTEAVVQQVFSTLSALLPPPSNLVNQIQSSLRNVIRLAVDLSIEMRTQRPEYFMPRPLHPEYDTNGDLMRKVFFNASLMNERSGDFADNAALEVEERSVRVVLFPLVLRKGDEAGEGSDEIVVAPAQVLVSRTEDEEAEFGRRAGARGARSSSARGGGRGMLGAEHGNRSQMSIAPSGDGLTQ